MLAGLSTGDSNSTGNRECFDLGESEPKYKVGDEIRFTLKYMGALGIMNSRYVDKVVE